MTGKIHSVFSGGTVDGPGIRFVVFMQGCPLRCKYCHNPDSWLLTDGEERTVSNLTQEIIRYRSYYGEKGGVTVSGGEPLLQIDFVTELLKSVKNYGINTAVDTSGYTFDSSNEETVKKHEELDKYVDLYLLDIKHIDGAKHKVLTGVDNKNTLEYAKWLSARGKRIWIRHVLVPGYTDDRDSLQKLSEFIKTINVEKIEVLPYHTMGEVKYQKLGLDYALKGVEPPSKESVATAKEILGVSK
ncbi:MAG: pyruvate formate lyase-activating protein [Clostridiales bacterium]|nr:pyruvate formate lyase-activating protein [Clostridiales bacterium]